ncbi:MAG TPA: hypothetical protein VIR34_14050 [Gemmatimonadaceae bacterium]|jgi:hypothetical protein
MTLSIQRAQPDSASCTGRPAACRRVGLHVAKPRARGRVAVEGSRSTRVSAMRISRRAVASRLRKCTERWADMTRRTTMRGTPLELRYLH